MQRRPPATDEDTGGGKAVLDSGIDIGSATQVIDELWTRSAVPALCDFIRVPSQSPIFDPEWETNGLLDRSIEVLVNWVRAQNIDGATVEVLRPSASITPVIWVEVDACGGAESDEAGTILMYGHADTQPPMTEDWDAGLGPYTPVEKDGMLYGRGSCDDGYALFAAVSAVQAVKAQSLNHGKIVIFIEASEESGSIHLPQHLEAFSSRIGTPSLIICLDSGCGNYEQLWMVTSLRGVIVGELTVSGIREGVHSGDASGIVPSSFRIARQLLDRIEDSTTGVVKDFGQKALYCDIPLARRKQTEFAVSVLGDETYTVYPFLEGAKPVDAPSLVELALNRTWKPQLEITGAAGLPTLAAAGNVLRPYTTLTLSMRTPPNVDVARAEKALKDVLEESPPLGVHVGFELKKSGSGWDAPAVAPWLALSADRASERVFGKKCCYVGRGGSIPFMGMLGKMFPEAQFLITGVVGPKANNHGPNEMLHLPYTKKLCCCLAAVVADHAAVPAWIAGCKGDPSAKRRRTAEEFAQDCC